MKQKEGVRIRLPKTVGLHGSLEDREFVLESGNGRKRKHIVTIETEKGPLRTLAAIITSLTEEIEDE